MKTIDAKKVIISFGGKNITGYADGEFVSIDTNDAFADQVGADGEMVRIKSNDTSAEVMLTLMQSSKSNQDLSDIAILDQATGAGVLPFSLTDLTGTTLVAGAEAWIKKKPKVGYSKSGETRAWTIKIANALVNIGGN